MARLFGTDGVRGLAGGEQLTAELATAVAASAATVLLPADQGRPRVAVGRDTRPSGEMLEAAAVAGFTSAGCDVTLLGVVPTPAVALETARGDADLGLMISASHNPMPDNGLKLFGRGGWKLPDEVEDAVEAGLGAARRATGAQVGRVRPDAGAGERYLAHLLAAVPTQLGGLRVVVDCAQGAASALAPEAYRRAGADVVAISADGDGLPHQRRLRRHLPRTSAGGRGRLRRSAGPGARRRRGPVPGRRRQRGGRRRRPAAGAAGRRPRRGHRRGDGDEQPGLRAGHARARHRRACRRASATGTCWRRCAPADTCSAASRAGTPCSSPTPRPATAC